MPCHLELVVEGQYLVVDLVALLHVHARSGADIGDEVLALVLGDVAVDGGEFLLDDLETVVDEHRGREGDLVLVLYPVLVVDVDEGVEDVLSPGYRDVVVRKDNDVGVLLAEGRGELRRVLREGSVHGRAADAYLGILLLGIVVDAGGYDDISDGGGKGVSHSSGNLLPELVLTLNEVTQGDVSVLGDVEGESRGLDVGQTVNRDGYRESASVKEDRMEPSFLLVGHVKTETVDDLHHVRFR